MHKKIQTLTMIASNSVREQKKIWKQRPTGKVRLDSVVTHQFRNNLAKFENILKYPVYPKCIFTDVHLLQQRVDTSL